MDPFQKFKPRRAPGVNTIADFLIPTKPAPAPKSVVVTPKDTLEPAKQLGGALVVKVAQTASREAYDYAGSIFSSEQDHLGQGPIRGKVFDQVGHLLLPKRFIKALSEIGEGDIPGEKRPGGNARGAAENRDILARDERLRVERAAALARLFPLAYGSPSRAPLVVALALSVLNGSIQPEHIQPVNAAALANQAAAEGIRQALVHERADP